MAQRKFKLGDIVTSSDAVQWTVVMYRLKTDLTTGAYLSNAKKERTEYVLCRRTTHDDRKVVERTFHQDELQLVKRLTNVTITKGIADSRNT